MLVALTEDHQPFVINPRISPMILKKMREQRKFYCPQCGEILQLKIGSVKIPHFAHYRNNYCESYFSEGESEQHLLGKEQLYQLFSYLQLPVKLEPYLSPLKQRPDLLIEKGNSRYAIEFQCSSIKYERFIERNHGFLQHNITPLWIIRTPMDKINGTGLKRISLSFQFQQFIKTSNGQKFLITYNPTKKEFVYLSNFIHLKGHSFLLKVSTIPLFKQKFPFYVPKLLSAEEFSTAYLAYHSFIKRYLKSRVCISRQGVKDLFLKSIYELRLSLHHLPPFIGVPIRGNEVLKVCAVEWQTALFYFIHLHGIKVHAMKRSILWDFLNWAQLNNTREAIDVVEGYCHVLNELSIERLDSRFNEKMLEEVLYKQFLATGGKY